MTTRKTIALTRRIFVGQVIGCYSVYQTLNDLAPVISDLNSYYNLHCNHNGPCAAS